MNMIMLKISLILFISSRDMDQNAILRKSSFFCELPLHLQRRKADASLAPVLDRVDIPTGVKMMEGGLFTPNNPSIARQYPNPEIDAVWAELELTRTIVISGEDVRKLGKDPETVAKFEDDFWGLGDDAYMAQMGKPGYPVTKHF